MSDQDLERVKDDMAMIKRQIKVVRPQHTYTQPRQKRGRGGGKRGRVTQDQDDSFMSGGGETSCPSHSFLDITQD